MPGSPPATSQLDWLSSTTAMIVLSWSKATRDLLKSFGWGIGALRQLFASDDGAISSPLPHTISLLEGTVYCELVSETGSLAADFREGYGRFRDHKTLFWRVLSPILHL